MKIKSPMIVTSLLVLTLLVSLGTVYPQPASYHTYEQLENDLKALAKSYPELIHLEDQGKTLEGRTIWSVTLGAKIQDIRPAILLAAGVDAADLAGTEMLLQFISNSARNYGKADSATKMLDETLFYIFPRVNPDASEALFNKPVYARIFNTRPMDLDRDGKADEDGYDDLNKDGQITWMRITEPGGEWMDDEEYPGLLRKADAGKNETGVYRLLREGYDNDGDGQLNEDEPGGVDFNRNFTYHYSYFEPGSGPHQISETESRAVADFVFAHPNITAVFSFSNADNLNTTWDVAKAPAQERSRRGGRKPVEEVEQKDAPLFSYVSESYKEITRMKDFPGAEKGQGAFNEWAYFHFGRWSFSTPAWWPSLSHPQEDTTAVITDDKKEEKGNEKNAGLGGKPGKQNEKSRDQRLWDWLQKTGQEDAFVPWTEFKHPDFPDKKVEVGGFKPFASANPPADSLGVKGEKYSRFFLQLSNWLPRLEVPGLKVEDLHDNVFRISLNVVNEGFLPSNTRIGVDNQWCPKVKVQIELTEGQKMVSGKSLQFIERLEGSGGSEEFSWMIWGKKGETLKINIGSPMTGMMIKMITL